MAAGRDMRARLLLTLRDGISAGLGQLQRQLNGIAGMARRIGAVGAALAAISFAGPVQAAAQYQDTLLQAQITAGGVGAAAHAAAAEAGRAWETLALETGQRSTELARGAANLVAAGLNREDMQRFMPVIARTATATGASIEDLSRTVIALRQNLGITSADAMADTLGAMAQAGKSGMFELRDMAREFPQLTAAAQSLGMTGRDAATSLAAMLQVARQGAGSSAEAANNLANFLQKITSPETVRNFRELGVNIQGVLQDAARQGINPIEAVLQKLRERTGGDMFRIGQVFGDRQVLDFIRPMLRGTQEYLDILRGAREANASLINQDFATRMAGAHIRLQETMERTDQLLRRVGVAASEGLGPLNDILAELQRGIAWMDANYPGVIDKTILWVAGFTLLAGALGVLMPVLGVLATGIGILFSPIGLLAAVLVGAAYIIWSNWEEFEPFFRRLWDALKVIFEAAARFVRALVDGDWTAAYQALTALWGGLQDAFSAIWDIVRGVFRHFVEWVDGWSGGAMSAAIAVITAPWRAIGDFFTILWDGARTAFDGFSAWLSAWVTGPIASVITAITTAWSALTGFFDGLWTGITERFDRFAGYIRETFASVAQIVERITNAYSRGREAQQQREAQAPVLGQVRGSANGARRFDADGTIIEGGQPAPVSGGQAPPIRTELSGRLQVDLAPGLVLRNAESTAPGVAITGSQGPVLGRP
ncbi:phage tail tape measure protein [Roseomonas sp. HJA6]|uniref:Phage tail tape measure protein n=1 Tax=Roseomonas alba TaxID=2846776 RepID=A0ABS7AIZ2_9PROT|nr:phage tail tape measure protein [Neoroseomonas alba]MBW6402030.1 phage tail tape measure protein [Neoroseomonas alba]